MPSLYSQFGQSNYQYQRDSNLLEKILSTMQVPTQAIAGAANAVMNESNPLQGAQDYVAQHKSFINLLQEHGIQGIGAAALGTVANVALDPLMYTGMGELTEAGKVARLADIAGDASKTSGSLDVMYEAALGIDAAGQYGKNWSQQAAAGQRALLTFGGQPVMYGAKVLEKVDQVRDMVGNSVVGTTFGKMFGKLKSAVPEWMNLRNQMRKGLIGAANSKLEAMIGPESEAYYDATGQLGVSPDNARDILRDTVERSRPDFQGTNLIKYATDAEFKKYTRWTWDAEVGARGGPGQLIPEGPEPETEFMEAFPGRRRRPNLDAESIRTAGSDTMEGYVDTVQSRAAAGGRPLKGVSGDYQEKIVASEIDSPQGPAAVFKQGKSGKIYEDTKGLGTPNYFGLTDSWDFAGRMPDRLTKVYEDRGQVNTVKAIRRMEDAWAERYAADNLSNVMGAVAEKYGAQDIKGLSQPLTRAVGFINAANAAFLATERSTGLHVEELAGDFNYLKRMMTPEGRDAFIAANGISRQASSYDISVRFKSQLQRDDTLRKMTISEINDKSMAGELSILTGGKKVKLFEDEPFFSTFVRGTDSNRAIEAAKMAQDAIKVYGRPVEGTVDKPIHSTLDAPPGYAFLPDRIAEDLNIRGYTRGMLTTDVALPKDVVNLLQSHYERVLAPAELQPLLRGYDSLQRMWKNITLPVWPAFQARNGMNDLLMITHGADDYGLHIPEAIGAIKDAAYGMAGKSDTINIGQEAMKWDDFKGMLDQYNLIDYTPGRDLDDRVLRPKGLKNFRQGFGGFEEKFSSTPLIEFGIRSGMVRQNATNAGYFLGLLRRGIPPDVAALEVKKRLFDFGDLTDIEKQVLRRVFPFYSWLRHNIPYQIAAVLHKPRILSEIQWGREYASEGQGPAGDTLLPSFLAQSLPVAWGGKDRNPEFGRLLGLLPQADLLSLTSPVQQIENSLSPLIKTPLEMATNYDTFQQQALERYPGESVNRLGVPVSRRWAAPLLDEVRPISELNNLTRDTPISGKVSGLLLAKDYKVDADMQSRLAGFKLQEEQVRVKKMMYQAASRGDSGAIIKLRQYLMDVQNNPGKLLR